MTIGLKNAIDEDMMDKWYMFVGREALYNPEKSYEHLQQIIMDGAFTKRYVTCDRRHMSFWIFILCDGEIGFFDGYNYHETFPQGLAKLLDIEQYFNNEFKLEDGEWQIN